MSSRNAWLIARGSDARALLKRMNEGSQAMNRNILYAVIAVLGVAAVVFGYQLYQERQKTTGVEINVGKSSITIEKK
jgi:hypothetical protein